MEKTVWLDENERAFASLEGRTIVRVTGEEWALEEGPPPVFTHPDFDGVQLGWAVLELDDGSWLRLTNYQNDDAWGLGLDVVSPDEHREPMTADACDPCSMGRPVDLDDWLLGRVERVSLGFDSMTGDLTEACLVLGERCVYLLAGEFDETADGLLVRLPDESVLMFRSSEAVDRALARFGRAGTVSRPALRRRP